MKFIRIGLLIVLLLGLFLRLFGYNWDQGSHLHPDERFLTMVGVDTKLPHTFSGYMNPKTSTFNPANIGYSFYVYGTFPILINKVLAQFWYTNTYDTFHLQGRVLSGLADFFVVLFVYKLCGLLEKKFNIDSSIKLFAAFFYAIAVLPIQLSHFFTVDTFLNLFCWLSFYYSVKFFVENKQRFIIYMSLSGLFLGLAFACKISALYFAPLIGIVLIMGIKQRMASKKSEYLQNVILGVGIASYMLFFYFALRIGSPYYFASNSLLDPRISKTFINAILTLKSFENPQAVFPPAIQWVHAPVYLSLINMIFLGLGIPYFLLSFFGLMVLLIKKRSKIFLVIIFWVISFLLFQSLQFAKTMRYLIFVYPFMAIFAAIGLQRLLTYTKHIRSPALIYIHLTMCIVIVFWPLSFFSIYTKDHSRVTASKWIVSHIPSRSVLLSEYWDDPLPLFVENPTRRGYRGIEVHIFDPDTQGKWDVINAQLTTGDYYIMSSNRGWGSVPTVPERFPTTTKFYKDMLQGKGSYSLIKEFTSYPSLRYLGIPLEFPDQWAEEAFTVYDHPKVMIFKKKNG